MTIGRWKKRIEQTGGYRVHRRNQLRGGDRAHKECFPVDTNGSFVRRALGKNRVYPAPVARDWYSTV